jgi:hypothetical protein
MPELMRRQFPNTCALTYAPNHSPKRLTAPRLLRIFAMTATLILRDPLFDLNREHEVV